MTAQAAEKMLDLRLTSHQRLLAQRGEDLEEILDELESENEAAASRGLQLTTMEAPKQGSSPATPPEQPSGEDTDDPDEAPQDAEDAATRSARRNGNGRRATSRVFAASPR